MRLKELFEAYGDSNLGLTIFDIDDTLFHTTAKIKVVKDGNVVKTLDNQQFNNYELQPGEEFDFGEFRNAEKFNKESEPMKPMIAKLNAILQNAGDSKVIMLTAREDFDDKDLFLDTFRQHGINIDLIHVHRAGNIRSNAIPAEKKAVFVRRYLDTGKYGRVRMYDDSMTNLKVFNKLQQDYPNVKFSAYFVNHDGSIRTVRDVSEMNREEYNVKAKEKLINAALEAMHRLVKSKGERHSLGDYAFRIANSFAAGLSPRELEKLYVSKYGINEEDNPQITQVQLDTLEKYLDQLFRKLGIDVEFTRHFLDRVNDERNMKQITIKELAILFKDTYINYGKKIAQMGPDAQAVIKDMRSDINVPFVLNWDSHSQVLDLVAKTVMRKKNFTTPNPELPLN
jgi:hypothetical protein